jgi:hypothetical protein
MRRLQRFVSATVLIALSGALAGCGSMSNWDPMDMLDFLDTKKKLPGDRKPVFPEGVPGLQQGVPKELYKGSNVEQQQQDAAAVGSPPPAAEEPKSAMRGAKSKAKGKPMAVSAAPAQDQAPAQDPDAAAPEEEGGTAMVPPAPKPKKMARRRTTSLPNDEPAAQQPARGGQQSQAAQPSNSPFPAPVPSGTFQR